MRRALAAGLTVAVLVTAAVALWGRRDEPPAPASTPAAAQAATPERPSGRFVPTWLPGDLRVQTEQEGPAGGSGTGWSRTYIRRGPFTVDQDVLTISLADGAPALDVEAEAVRYAGARPTSVQGRPALLLEAVAARHGAALVWSPSPGRLAQVLGSGVSLEELAGVAEGLPPSPRLDATPLPAGFTESQRSDEHPFPTAVPRQYALGTMPLRGGARSPGAPSVQILAGWDGQLPPVGTSVAVRDRAGVATTDGERTALAWPERPGLVVTVTGTNVGLDDVRKIASQLRELSIDEVTARPSGAPVTLARGEAGGMPYELRTYSGGSGQCLALEHNWVQSQCGGNPLEPTADFEAAIFQGLAYGAVVPGAMSVRIELDGGRTVETAAIAGRTSAFFVADVPADAQLVAVVAIGPDGQALERRTPAR